MQVVIFLIGPEQICVVKCKTIQDNLYFVLLIIVQIDGKAKLISLVQSKAIHGVDNRFQEAVLGATGVGL